MIFSNSALVTYTELSPNHSGKRTKKIERITPHCASLECSAKWLGGLFSYPERQASSNYGIGLDGQIGMYVEEKNRSWCSSSEENDQRAVTIECSSEETEPFKFSETVYRALIRLCIDICRRNGKIRLLWIDDKEKALNYPLQTEEMLLTVHRWFSVKSCPGEWLYSRMGELAREVTDALQKSQGL